MIRKTITEKGDNSTYVIGLIDDENYLPYLPTKNGDYPITYGIPENARGLDYFQNIQEGNLTFGYKTKMYREYKEGVEWKDRKRYWCKNNGIFAVFRVKRGYLYDNSWGYPHTIRLVKPLFFLRNRIVFQDLKTLIPESEYVKNYRRYVTRFSKTEAKKILEMMRKKNPEIAEEINKLF